LGITLGTHRTGLDFLYDGGEVKGGAGSGLRWMTSISCFLLHHSIPLLLLSVRLLTSLLLSLVLILQQLGRKRVSRSGE
jgi:fluoride ion exporter CrcB/FEX